VNTLAKIIVLTLVVSVAAFLLAPVLWPPAPGTPTPQGAQLVFFILLAILSALTFGAGVAFLAFGWPVVRYATDIARVPAWPLFVALGWLLVSWWPHNNLHLSVGGDLSGVLAIEYAFHVSMYVAGLIVVWFFLAAMQHASTPAVKP
jgi:hypothetical protein